MLRSPLLIIAISFATLSLLVQKNYPSNPASDYVGTEKCLSCHQAQKSFLGTSHYLTSRVATRESIAGKFEDGQNILNTSDPELFYRMEARKEGFYQTAILGTVPNAVYVSKRFDLVLGSGRKGQTYLYWDKSDLLYELPVSYWTELGTWVHSPGYEEGVVNFNRPVPPRCLECHASFFESLSDSPLENRYNRSNHILGISCERCHGPGREHSALHLAKPAKQADEKIVNPARISRERQLGLCALCHGGIGVSKTPAFSYTVGKDLQDYLELKLPSPTEAVDVHGNQVALLERSRCFQSSTMTCSTCHNSHVMQRDVADFSERCLACHKVQSCGLFATRKNELVGKCVDCHLPKQTSNVIVSSRGGAKIQPQVRTHWIKVYSN